MKHLPANDQELSKVTSVPWIRVSQPKHPCAFINMNPPQLFPPVKEKYRPDFFIVYGYSFPLSLLKIKVEMQQGNSSELKVSLSLPHTSALCSISMGTLRLHHSEEETEEEEKRGEREGRWEKKEGRRKERKGWRDKGKENNLPEHLLSHQLPHFPLFLHSYLLKPTNQSTSWSIRALKDFTRTQ